MRFFQIDAFADAPFTGNPAAVCLLDGASVNGTWMQNVAAEMNLSETAFVRRQGSDWSLRWFSPAYHTSSVKWTSPVSRQMLLEAGWSSNLEYYTNSYQEGVEQPRFSPGWLAGASRTKRSR